MPKTIAPYGTWRSPITSSFLTSSGVSLSECHLRSESVYWLEGRPLEGGRVSLIQDGFDRLPSEFNVRTRAHEYGGGAYTVHGTTVFFANFTDQRLYRQDHGSLPLPITPEPPSTASLRYTDMRVTPDGSMLVCVRERHESSGEVVNELVAMSTHGLLSLRIAEGHDFFSSPKISPDSRHLAWLTWDHPNMPWDGTELWRADLGTTGELSRISKVAGGSAESVFQPEWSAGGELHYISDRTGWWNLYAGNRALCPMEAEFGLPQWVFGLSRYGFLGDGRIASAYTSNGRDYLGLVDPRTGTLETLPLPYTDYEDIRTDGQTKIAFIAGSPTVPQEVVLFDVKERTTKILKSSMSVSLSSEELSIPEPIEYPVPSGRTAHALFYAPVNQNFEGDPGERPPLLVMSHGGPTAATASSLKIPIQYWTSRGFAVADVDYGGSTGYGREYRERLNGRWGIVDREDCAAVVHYLAGRGLIDPKRASIRGGSAGGYTTLCALVFDTTFAAGASHYGVGDLTALALDTHKFESRYLDRLVGPYPAAEQIYRERSPIHFTDRLSCPVILFQGLDDRVVPPSQAESFVAALKAKGIYHEYVALPGEGHGFRKAESIQRVAEAELEFYAKVFGFSLPAEK